MLDTVEKVLEFTSGEKILTKDNSIFMCVVAQNDNDDCNYAICETCEGENKSRKRCCIVDREKRRKRCYHEIHNLNMLSSPWWCGTNHIGGQKWKNKPQGCSCCRKEFVGRYRGVN